MAVLAVTSSRPRRSHALHVGAMLAALLAMPHAPDARANTQLFVGGDLTGFHYEEFTDDGALFNREEGPVAGIRLGLHGEDGGLFTRLGATYHSGEVDYWSPANGDSITGTRFLTLAVEAGGWIDQDRRWGPFVRVARRFWGRDIHGTDNAAGLYEEYRWTELGFGVRRRWGGGDWRHEISAMAYAVTGGSMFVELSGVPGRSWDDETLDLGNENGFRLRYSATVELASGNALRIEPYYEYWEFGRSNEARVTANGVPTNLIIWEPRSESERVGVAVGLMF